VRGALAVAGILALGALGGAFATSAFSHGYGGFGPGGHHMGHHMGHYMGMGGHGFMGGPFGGAKTPQEAEERAERMVNRFADRIDATREQQEKLETVAKALAKDMLPLRDGMKEKRAEALKILGAEKVDRAALEKLRADQIAQADAISKRLTDALAEAAEILTPEQRQKVALRIERRSERRGWRHHD
jgi:Spy/CpxP family protein refolding chaperone